MENNHDINPLSINKKIRKSIKISYDKKKEDKEDFWIKREKQIEWINNSFNEKSN
jgi:hypothetical protein